MPKATWQDALLVEADQNECALVEGNVYFPASALQREHFEKSNTRTHCPWKGEAHYFNVRVGSEVNRDAAWYYPDPRPAAEEIRDKVAFWKGVFVDND